MAFTLSCEPSDALLRAMEARVGKRASLGSDFPPPAPTGQLDVAGLSSQGASSASTSRPAISAGETEGAGMAKFKISGPPPMSAKPLLSESELQHLLAGGDSAAQVRSAPQQLFVPQCRGSNHQGAPANGSSHQAPTGPSNRQPPRAAASRQPPPAPTRRPAVPSQSKKAAAPKASTAPLEAPSEHLRNTFESLGLSYKASAAPPEAPSELRRPRAGSACEVISYESMNSKRGAVTKPTGCVPELQKAELFLANRVASNQNLVEIPEESAIQENADQAVAEASGLGQEGEVEAVENSENAENEGAEASELVVHEIGGTTFAEVGDNVQHIPSVVTFAGVPAAQDGDLVYLGGGMYASAVTSPPKAAPSAPKRAERSRMLPGRVRPGKQASLSAGPPRSGRSASQPPPSQPSIDEHGFMMPPPLPPTEKTPPANAAPPAWRPAGATKRPGVPIEPERPPRPAAKSEYDGLMIPGGEIRRALDSGPGNMEARVRDREASRKEGQGLFGRQGFLREIADMEMRMPLPVRNRGDGPMASEVRAEERRMAKHARVEALLEERAEQERLSSEARKLSQSLTKVSSAPVLPSLGSSLGVVMAQALPDEMEKQKLRVACKMETLSFLNGYHNAIGKMSMEQKASLLAKLHCTKSAKPRQAHCAKVESNGPSFVYPAAEGTSFMDEEFQWDCGEQMGGYHGGIQDRLQHVNDMCNEAFDFDTEL